MSIHKTVIDIPPSHPRYASLMSREKIVEGLHTKVVTESGLIAHGRGESLDYFLGESTASFGLAAARAAAARLLISRHPVLSVNGNTMRIGIQAPSSVRVLRGELTDWSEPKPRASLRRGCALSITG